MSALTPAMAAAVAAPSGYVFFGALQIDLPSYTLRLLDGSAHATFNGGTFTGRDATFGVWAGLELPEEGAGDEAPSFKIILHPPSDAAAATLSAANMQGSRVRIWFGALVRATGAVVADPDLLQDGLLDQPTLSAGKKVRRLEYECASQFERLFENEEGFRLSDANHQRIWPGEEGLEHMSGLVRKVYWGMAGPAGAAGGSGNGTGSAIGTMGPGALPRAL
jgi:hypothetical protein